MAKKLNTSAFAVVILVVVVIILLFKAFTEGFGAGQPGTRVQLQTSHVITQEEADEYRKNCGTQVRNDITHMTGADPGEILCAPF